MGSVVDHVCMGANGYFGQLWGGGAGEGLVGSGMKGGKGERLRVGGIHPADGGILFVERQRSD